MKIHSILRLVLICALPFIAIAPSRSASNNRNTSRHMWTAAPVNVQSKSLKPAVPPLGLRAGLTSSAPVTVMVQLAGDPVTVQAANAIVPMTAAQKSAAAAALAQVQQGVAAQIQALGGSIQGNYQHAYNGIRVRIAADKLPALTALNNVTGVHRLIPHARNNTHGVPLIGAPQVWQGVNGKTGLGMKIAIIDTGIDYTHADFGGPGTPAAYQAALAQGTAAPDPALVGPAAPKVKGGTDFVGDDYDADSSDPARQVPHPDPNPLDCFGHGSHVAGTAGGFGVLADGTTFHGPYDANTISSHSWLVGPGVAPQADLYALRVFGCEGSTNVVVDAIEWAVKNKMDVINMSLGSGYGDANNPEAVSASNAAKAGVIVVASAGNAGGAPYILGAPSSGDNVLSVAASDPTSGFPGATITLSTGPIIQAIEANGVSVAGLGAIPVTVLFNGMPHDAAHMSLGCDPDEYTATDVAGDLAVVRRGTCARVARAIYGQQAGAAAVLMVNNATSFPPFEGQITSNPDTGESYTVTIPFLGVRSADRATLAAADGGTATFTDITIPNPGYLAPASFTSGGPRSGDSASKPNLTAPGVSISSVGIGTGTGPGTLSGTSMAAPHTAGSAALVRQAHPDWKKVFYWNAAIINTTNPNLVQNYSAPIAGAGLLQVQQAVLTNAVAFADDKATELNFGFAELNQDFQKNLHVKLHNFSAQPVTFDISSVFDAGVPHSITFNQSQVTVGPRGEKDVEVRLSVPAATAGDSSAFNRASGLVRFTPAGGGNNGVVLDVPWLLVPQELSSIRTDLDTNKLRQNGSAIASVKNDHGPGSGNADWFAWGLADGGGDNKAESANIQNVGVQSFPSDEVLAFAISTKQPWSNAAQNEYDILVDLNGDGAPDYLIIGADLGLLTSGSANGTMAVAVFNLATNDGSIEFLADAPLNSSTLVLPVLFSQLCGPSSPCLSAANPRFTYTAQAFSRNGGQDFVAGTASFNAFNPALSTGMFDTVAPGQTVNETATLNAAEFMITPPRGFMIVSHDNKSDREAQTIEVKLK